MSTATAARTERESPVDAMLEDVPHTDLEAPPSELAPETPLTREAVIHLRAAAGEVSRGFTRVSSILGAIKRGLYNPVVGDDLTLGGDTAFELRELCDAAVDVADHKMQRPVFERGRGERPHGAGPYLSLDAEELDELILRLTTAICVGLYDQRDSEELREARREKMGKMVDNTMGWIEEQVGTDLYGDEMHDRASERAQAVVEELTAEIEDDDSEEGEGCE